MLDCLFETLATTKANISFVIHVNASQNSGHSSTEVTRFCFQSTRSPGKRKSLKKIHKPAEETQYKYQMKYNNVNRQNWKCKQCYFEFLHISGHFTLLGGTFDCVFLVLANHESSQYFTPVLATAGNAVGQRHGHQRDQPPRHRYWTKAQYNWGHQTELLILPRGNFTKQLDISQNDTSKETRPQEIIRTDLIDVLFMSTPWQITTHCEQNNTIELIAKGGEPNYTLWFTR